jgi:tRNA threonylcarbamoyl adenosine modification protein (Sua5/YciO/YrdC/YwlC family)
MAVEILHVDIYNPNWSDILYAVEVLKKGGVIVYPTDTIYGLAADIFNKEAIKKIMKIKGATKQKLFTFIFHDFKSIADWAHIPTKAFRIMRRVLPGQYTFVLPASNEFPKTFIQKRKTVGIRVPDSEIARNIAEELGHPLLNTSVPKGEDEYFTDPTEIYELYMHDIDLVMDAGVLPDLPSTVVDFTVDPPEILREGAGDVSAVL